MNLIINRTLLEYVKYSHYSPSKDSDPDGGQFTVLSDGELEFNSNLFPEDEAKLLRMIQDQSKGSN